MYICLNWILWKQSDREIAAAQKAMFDENSLQRELCGFVNESDDRFKSGNVHAE